jgi:accessory colonization factor AcfC
MEQAVLTNKSQLIQKAMQILLEKSGTTDTNRFLSLKSSQRLDSVLRHQNWQKTLDNDVFLMRFFELKNKVVL